MPIRLTRLFRKTVGRGLVPRRADGAETAWDKPPPYNDRLARV